MVLQTTASHDSLVQRGCIIETLHSGPVASLRQLVKARSAAPHTLSTLLGPVRHLASRLLDASPWLFNEQV